MVSVTRDSPPSRDNFKGGLYGNWVTETKLTLLNYAYMLRRIFEKYVSSFALLSF